MTLGFDPVALGNALGPVDPMALQWGVVQSNNADGTANIRLGGSTMTIVAPYATAYPALPGRKVGVLVNKADAIITHIVAPAGPPFVKVTRQGGVQSIPNNTNTAVIHDTLVTDPWGMWNGVSSMTVPVGGIYGMEANTSHAASATGTRALLFTLNGTAIAYTRLVADATTGPIMHLSATAEAAAGDTFQHQVFQNSGASQNIAGSQYYDEHFGLWWLGWSTPAATYGPELLVDPGFESLTLNDWSTFWSSNLTGSITTTAGEFASGAGAFKGTGTGSWTVVLQPNQTVAVRPGDVYKVSGKVRSSISLTGTGGSGAYIEVVHSPDNPFPDYFGANSTAASVYPLTSTSTTYKQISAEWTVPDGVYFARPGFRGAHTATANMFWDDLSMTKKDLQ